MFDIQMESTAQALVARGRGILAADESTGTIEKRFKSVGAVCTEENRRAYRERLFTTAGLGEFISGVILFDETIRQQGADGTPLGETLHRQGIIPGIKVNKSGRAPLPVSNGAPFFHPRSSLATGNLASARVVKFQTANPALDWPIRGKRCGCVWSQGDWRFNR